MKPSGYMRYFWQIVRMHLQPHYRVPLTTYIHLTNRCNMHCVYCRIHQLPQVDIWTTQALKTTISEMNSCGTRRIHLTGGEPMLREDLGEIVAHAKKLGLFVGLSTNGYRVVERINELKGIDVVFLSYDGPDQVQSRLRGGQKVSDVETALLAFKAAGIRVWTTTVLTRWNADFLEDIVNFALRHHILANFNELEFFSESPYKLHPPINEIKELILRGRQRKEVFQKLIQLKSSGAPVGSSFKYLKNALDWPYDDKITDSKTSKRYQCWAGRAYGHLDADGKLYSCGWGALRGIGGINVMEEGFYSVWKRLLPLDGCRSCSHACGVENNLIFSLNPSSILNAVVQLRR